jgi:hypothetical protein
MAQTRWHQTTSHGNRCRKCNEAAAQAKTDAIVRGVDIATFTITQGLHSATVERSAQRG